MKYFSHKLSTTTTFVRALVLGGMLFLLTVAGQSVFLRAGAEPTMPASAQVEQRHPSAPGRARTMAQRNGSDDPEANEGPTRSRIEGRTQTPISNQNQNQNPNQRSQPDVGKPVKPIDMNKDLRNLPKVPAAPPFERPEFRRHGPPNESEGTKQPAFPTQQKPFDAVLQLLLPQPSMPVINLSFDGIDRAASGCACSPPDTNGDVGPNHYIQSVNVGFEIWNKSGTVLQAATTFNTLWGTGGANPCTQGLHQGDPIVMYDQLVDRWVVSDFAFAVSGPNTVAPYYECVAVSKTADPVSGGWWLYAIQQDTVNTDWLGDYPKFGVWSDGWYGSYNMFCGAASCTFGPRNSFQGVQVFALNRATMITGAATTPILFRLTPTDLGDSYSLLPGTFRFGAPPAGREEFFAAIDSPATSATILDKVHIRKFHVDFGTPLNSTLSAPTDVTVANFQDAFDATTGSGNIVPQSGTSVLLDTVGDRLFMNLFYQNVSGTESLWATHTINNAAPTAVRWYQFNVTGGTVAGSPVQQGTYDGAADGLSRWMPSLALDQLGNMAIGYSASNASNFPSIRYNGRLTSDSAGVLGQGESIMTTGSGSQTTAGGRWGDYSQMTIDPTNGCTLWFTSEYLTATGSNWRTRVGSFAFPACIGAGNLTGTVTDASTTLPLAGATVTAGGYVTTTNGSGVYSFNGIVPATYTVTATQPGYADGVANNVVVTNGGTTIQDFALSVCSITTKTWIGAGAGGAGTDFNTAANWSPSGVPTACNDVVMTLTSGASITLSADASIHNLSASISGANNIFLLNVGTRSLTINGTTTGSAPSGNGGTQLQINVGASPGQIVYVGDATFSATGGPTTFPMLGIGNTTGQIVFRGNATFNAGSGTSTGNMPAKVVFDAAGAQTITDNAGTAIILLGNSSTEIGSSNTPTVTVAGTASNFQPQGNLNIKAGATLDLTTKTFNRSAAGGTLTLNSGAFLKLAANTGGQTGSNFPSNFSAFSLNAASTVEYNAAGGTNQTIFNTPAYGHLTLSRGSGAGGTTKTAGGALTVAGDLTIQANATFAAGTSLTHNLGGNWVNNGAFTFTTANTINFNTAGVKTISGSTTTAFSSIIVNKGSDTTNSIEATVPMSMSGNLTLTNGLLKLTNAAAIAQFNAGPTIASTAGVWVNGGTLNGGNFSSTNNGLVKITSGAATFGTASGNALTNNAAGTVDIQGGTISFSGRLVNVGGTVSISGGTTKITTVGNASGTLAGFDMNAGSTLNMTAGTVEFQNANSSGTPNDLKIVSGGSKSISGGTFQMGNGSTPGGQNFKINSGVPLFNLTLSSAATLNAAAAVNGALTLNNDLTATGFVLTENGTSAGSGDVIGDVLRTDLTTTPKAFGNPNVQIAINSGSITSLTLNLDKGQTPTDFPQAVLRNYTLTPGAGTLTQGTVRLRYLDAELNSNSEGSTLHLWRKNGLTWTDQGQSSFDSSANWVEQNNVTSFSPWVISGPSAPTAVKLTKFEAASSAEGVALTWESGYEVNNLGYHLFREQNGKRTRVTPSPVAGSALKVGPHARMTAGFAYSWFDRQGTSDSAYYLEAIDLNGRKELSGPIYALPGSAHRTSAAKRAALLSEIASPANNATNSNSRNNAQTGVVEGPAAMKDQSGKWKAIPTSDLLQVQQNIAAGAAVKISVRHDGWYRLGYTQLLAGCLDPTWDARYLQLYVDGAEVPMRVNTEQTHLGPNDSIEFYGKALDTPSTDTHVYWLVNGSTPGKRITGKSAKVKAGDRLFTDNERFPSGFEFTVERSDKLVYFAGLLNGDGENIFGPPVTSEPVNQTLSVTNPDSEMSQAGVAVDLQGLTAGDHVVQVQLNGSDLGTITFAGQDHASQSFAVARTLIHAGDNTVTLKSTGGESDVSLIGSVRLTYGHAYSADSNRLRFSISGGQTVMVNRFSSANIRVIDTTNPDMPNEIYPQIGASGAGYAFKLKSPGNEAHTYLAFVDELAEQPASVIANEPSTWNSTANGADMVIVTPHEFRQQIEPLAALRRTQGLSVAVVDVEDIFDEYSYGAHAPDALKSFFNWTNSHWQVAPRYVLLAGDSSWDPRNYLDQGDGDLVPTKLIDTAYMETASDDWLADFTGDGVAEMALGRLPGRTAADIELMVNKIINFDRELHLGGPARGALFVADSDFGAKSSATQALLPAGMQVLNINRDAVGDDSAMHSQIVSAIDAGPLLVNYYGHGSVTVWTGEGLLDSDSAATLTNGNRLSIFMMMTCLNGYSHDAYIDSLGESLLKAPQGGAVAVWASAGFTEAEPQFLMNKEAYVALFAGASPRLGDAIRTARLTVLDNDVRRTWILLGDPTMRVR